MHLKIMVTGKNRKIATDISDHLMTDRGYSVVKCGASKEALFTGVPAEMPNVIIICLGDETKETVSVFDVLKECTMIGGVTLIVVANENDQQLFITNTKLEHMFFMSRPVSLFALYSKLSEIEKKVEENTDNISMMVTEYVNPHANDLPPRKHILVVDDDTEQLMQIKEHLKEFYEVTLVPSGDAAIKYLSKHSADLILLDYMMPEMNGPQVLENLRKMPGSNYIPVVFLTGVTEKDTVVKTLVELKPQGYIVKPSKKSELVAKIIDILG
ncbi:MAG: response regulator [Lachnospiraceae bacterium]|nr:response regulator [Lachnospiraceae bacterium]MBR5765743.1 response regulator [Lachnospiraceae bacterium]MBR6486863.1 response regulator [Lachnospiraceae bacterium]